MDSKDLVRGSEIFLWIGGTGSTNVIAFGTNASLEVNGEQITTTNKMSCRWASNLAGTNSYTVSSDSLYTAQSGATSYDTLMKAMLAGENVDWYMGPAKAQATGATCDEYVYELDTTKPYYSGEGLITSLNLNAGNSDEIVSCSMTLTGDGAVAQHNVD